MVESIRAGIYFAFRSILLFTSPLGVARDSGRASGNEKPNHFTFFFGLNEEYYLKTAKGMESRKKVRPSDFLYASKNSNRNILLNEWLSVSMIGEPCNVHTDS